MHMNLWQLLKHKKVKFTKCCFATTFIITHFVIHNGADSEPILGYVNHGKFKRKMFSVRYPRKTCHVKPPPHQRYIVYVSLSISHMIMNIFLLHVDLMADYMCHVLPVPANNISKFLRSGQYKFHDLVGVDSHVRLIGCW